MSLLRKLPSRYYIVVRYNITTDANWEGGMPRTTKREYEALAGFRYALREFLQFSEEAAKSNGLTPRQHQALLAILAFPGREAVTIGELATQLQIRPHSAVGLVDRLAAQGYVSRETNRADRRQVYVSLRPK